MYAVSWLPCGVGESPWRDGGSAVPPSHSWLGVASRRREAERGTPTLGGRGGTEATCRGSASAKRRSRQQGGAQSAKWTRRPTLRAARPCGPAAEVALDIPMSRARQGGIVALEQGAEGNTRGSQAGGGLAWWLPRSDTLLSSKRGVCRRGSLSLPTAVQEHYDQRHRLMRTTRNGGPSFLSLFFASFPAARGDGERGTRAGRQASSP